MNEHIAVIEAVRAKDAELAASYLGEHIGHLAEAFRAKLSTEPSGNVMRTILCTQCKNQPSTHWD